MKTRLLPLLGTVGVFSAAAVAENEKLEHVLVTVPLHPSTMETAFPVAVLSGDDLAREAAATLGDSIDTLPGVHNASFGPGVGQPVIRGLGGPRVMSLQNGTRSADVSALSADHGVAVEPLLADSIEVLRGPATLLYGGGAIGGVINVIDNRMPTVVPDDLEVGMAARYTGHNNGQSGVFRLDGGVGDVALHASAVVRGADAQEVPMGTGTEGGDEILNTGTHATAATLGTSYHFDGGFFGLAVNWQNAAYGLPAGTHGHEGDHDQDHDEDHEEDDDDHVEAFDDHDEHGEEEGAEDGGIRLNMNQTRYDAALHLHAPMPGIEVIRGFATVTDYQHRELEGGAVGTVYHSDSAEGRLEVLHAPLGGVHGVVGLQFSDTEFSAQGDESFVPRTDIRRAGVFLLEDWHTGSWQWEAGLRWDQESLDPAVAAVRGQDFEALSASLGVIFQPSDAWHLSASISRAERAPAVEELYSNWGNVSPGDWVTHAATGAIELGDPDLDTEVGTNVDVGLVVHRTGFEGRIAMYVNDFQRFINLDNTGLEVGETPVRQYVQGRARFVGAEVDLDFDLLDLAGGRLTLGLGGDVVRGELDGGGDIPRLPPASGTVDLAWHDDSTRYFTRVTRAARQSRPGNNEAATDGWWRWDAGGEWRLDMPSGTVLLSAAVRNIGNEEIRLSTSWLRDDAPEPGRSFDLGVRVEL